MGGRGRFPVEMQTGFWGAVFYAIALSLNQLSMDMEGSNPCATITIGPRMRLFHVPIGPGIFVAIKRFAYGPQGRRGIEKRRPVTPKPHRGGTTVG